ncbi:MAG: hypothetical protein JWO26_1470 [Rhodospirillales bacterium]|nr:hypothetical protein [Rhodospirillales bacterium]
MFKSIIGAALMTTVASTSPATASERVRISSDWGDVTAELIDCAATRRLVQMLPITVTMRDHLRQEKTGRLPAPPPAAERHRILSPGLWGAGDFVIYYRSGRVPSPGIIVLGRVNGDVSIFDRPGQVTLRLERAQ